MTGTRAEELLRHVRQDVPDDAELVRRFRVGDGAAFEGLVRRHGPLVLAVCLRTVNHRQDAEDAFQATFLTLARKAELIRDPKLLGNWLHGVAVRIAMRAKRSAMRRRQREVQAVNVPEPAASAIALPFEHDAAIHEEIERLPEYLRDAVLLCELRGVPRSEASAMLNIPEGTLSSRLAAGRKKLAERLARRGIVPGAALVSLAAVPESLIAATCRIAAGIAAPAHIERLMRGGFPMRSATIIVLGFSLSVVAAVSAGRTEEPPPATPAPLAAAEPKADAPPMSKDGYSTKPRLQKTMDVQPGVKRFAWSPDGKWFILDGPSIVYWNLASGSRGELNLGEPSRFVAITPDSKHVVTHLREPGLFSGRHVARFWRITGPVDGGAGVPFGGGSAPLRASSPGIAFDQTKEHDLDPDSTAQYGFPAGGETIRTLHTKYSKPGIASRVEVFEAKIGESVSKSVFATDIDCEWVLLSPRGTRVAALTKAGVNVFDVISSKQAEIAKLPEPQKVKIDSRMRHAAFSRDDSLLATALAGRSAAIVPAKGGKPVPLEDSEGMGLYVEGASFSSDNKLVAMTGVRHGDVPGPNGPQLDVPISAIVAVWDVRTGKIIKMWERREPWSGKSKLVAFHPEKLILAMLEPASGSTRLGLWDFSAEK